MRGFYDYLFFFQSSILSFQDLINECVSGSRKFPRENECVGVKHAENVKHVKTLLSPCASKCVSPVSRRRIFHSVPLVDHRRVSSRGLCILENQINVSRRKTVWRPRATFSSHSVLLFGSKNWFRRINREYKFINTPSAICGLPVTLGGAFSE